MIEKSLNSSSIPEPVRCRCVLGKDSQQLLPIGAKLSTPCGGPASRKTRKQNQKQGALVRVAGQTENAWFIHIRKRARQKGLKI